MRNEAVKALDELEQGQRLMASGYTRYVAALNAESRAIQRRAVQDTDQRDIPGARVPRGRAGTPEGRRVSSVSALEQGAGVERLAETIVRRMRALGLGPVLDHARASGASSERWPEDLMRAWPE